MITINKKHPFKLVSKALKPDNKKRVNIGKATSDKEDLLFDVYVNDMGQVMLDPVKLVPAHEAWIFENKKAMQSIKKGLDEAHKGKAKYLGSFSQYIEE
ncbi:MAG: hypothetical protein C5B43_04375 [Verrucomicrobia bacterium]|nr:MAG: hypothetical protein C5B43_04375 [Verrucomicrobiota bacterium]